MESRKKSQLFLNLDEKKPGRNKTLLPHWFPDIQMS